MSGLVFLKPARTLLNMIETIIKTSRSDAALVSLVDEAREYAQVYLLAKQRHKGCSGTGELMTLKEVVRHCKEKNYLSGDGAYDADSIADALVK